MKTFKKILRYIAYAGIIIGLLMLVYSLVRNQNLYNIIRQALKDSNAFNGFMAGVWGVIVIILSLVLLICTFRMGRKKPDKEDPE